MKITTATIIVQDKDGNCYERQGVEVFISTDGIVYESRLRCLEHEKMQKEYKKQMLQKIEDKCLEYNSLIDEYLEAFPERGPEDILEMLRRVRQRGRNKATRKAD